MTDIQLTHELIDQLNKLTSRLTAQGEYDAVDLIDTVVERVTEMPQRELLAEALEALTKTPLIEALTPTSEEWRTCETVQDTYDLMKHRIRVAADKIREALEHQP